MSLPPRSSWPAEKYVGFNHSHLTEALAEREGIQLSRQTISRLLNWRTG